MTMPIIFSLMLCWDPSPEPTVNQYRIYQDNAVVAAVTETRATIQNLESNRVYSFAVTAVNEEGLESDQSAAIEYVLPHLVMSSDARIVSFPISTKLANTEYHLESTSDFNTWREETYVVEGNTATHIIQVIEAHRFFRVKIIIRKEGCAA